MPGEGLEPLIFVYLIDYKICEGETESVYIYIYIYIDTKPLYKKKGGTKPADEILREDKCRGRMALSSIK